MEGSSIIRTYFMYVLLTICPIFGITATASPVWTYSVSPTEPSCPLQHIEVQQLPDLNIPRAGHFCYYANGEITVIGGHTTGFTPTATAEYYSDGQWHTVPTTYTHDQGLALRLKSGKVMIGGGHAQCMGVEQTYGVEFYDLAAHSSGDYGCLSRKRCFADAVELDSGRVFITGNWYLQDDIECYDGNRVYSSVADVHAQRSCPYLLRTSASDAIVFSALDIHGNTMDTIVVENMKGQLIDIPLLREWRPYQPQPLVFSSASAFIGDASKGQYAYLILVQNSAGQLAIAKVQGTHFSILPTACPIPRSTSSGQLHYSNYNLLADRQRGRAYLVTNNQGRLFVLCIEYAHATPQHPAPLTLYYTDSLSNNGLFPALALTPEGNILTVGGLAYDNFTPTATAFMLMLAAPDTASTSGIPHSLSIVNYPLSIIVGCLILALFILSLFHSFIFSFFHFSSPKASPAWTYSVSPIQPTSPQSPQSPSHPELMQRIEQLMQQQQLYLRGDLKVSHLARQLGLPPRRVSHTIRTCQGCTFAQYVNAYRVEHAKRLLSQQPKRKIASICTDSGFASESSFFRIFKEFTGATPSEWIGQQE